jgi:hypothetical protein
MVQAGMIGRKERGRLELFITGALGQLVPDDHILARVDRVLDLSWLRGEVAELYCADNGRPGLFVPCYPRRYPEVFWKSAD